MKLLFLTVLVLIASICADNKARIAHGTLASFGEFPHQVALMQRKRFLYFFDYEIQGQFCGGSSQYSFFLGKFF